MPSPLKSPWLALLIVCLAGAPVFNFVDGELADGFEEPLVQFGSSEEPPPTRPQLEARPSKIRKLVRKAIPRDKDWSKGMEIFAARDHGPESALWSNPPAARPLAPAILDQQRRAAAREKPWLNVRVAGEYMPNEYVLMVKLRGKSEEADLPFEEITLGPFAIGPLHMRLWLKGSTGWFSGTERLTKVAAVEVEGPTEAWHDVSLPPRPSHETTLGLAPIRFRVRAEAFLPNGESGDDGSPESPTQIEAVDLQRFLAFNSAHQGSVKFNSGDAVDFIRIIASARYTTVLFFADRRVTEHIQCHGIGDAPIPVGEFHHTLGLYAVATTQWTSLLCRVSVYEPEAEINYEFIAVSHSEPPFKPLLLAFMGRHLAILKHRSTPLSNRQVRGAVRWLERSYGVAFTAEDLEQITDARVRKRLRWLQDKDRGTQ